MKMNLAQFLDQISFLEPLDYKKLRSGTEICFTRVHEENVWFHMFGAALMAQVREGKDVLSVCKEYVIRGNALLYTWKVTVKDLPWFIEALPRMDKTIENQRNYKQEIDPRTGEGRVSLLGIPDGYSPTDLPRGLSATATSGGMHESSSGGIRER